MIIMGYPCIGKSSVARGDKEYIDLESSHFKIDGRDNTDWEKGYCDLALELMNSSFPKVLIKDIRFDLTRIIPWD